jgi:uncharacterized protein YdeI (YjbR/CyaY-like superfamily)
MMAGARLDQYERVEIENIAALRDWLKANHQQPESIWLVTYKKAVADRYVAYGDIVDEALCFGWIDSLPRKLDDMRTMVLLSPRKAGSGWSAVNKAKIERLECEGRLHESGLTAINRAKADGGWSKLDAVDQLIEPEDLKLALNALDNARRHFDAFSRSSRRGILEWIIQAKRPETRAKRINETAKLAALNIKANHPTEKNGGSK